MATPSELSVQSVVKWAENPATLKDFISKYPTPNVVKITKGQYRNIGVSKSVTSELLLHSVVTSNKVLAESIKLREGKKAIPSDQKFSLPLSYQGWFELLSEEGKSIKALTTVQDLFKMHPQSFLIRENIKGFVSNDQGEFAMDKTRIVYAGEQLNLVGDVFIPVPSFKSLGFGTKRRFLRCFDQKGESVYIGFDQRGLFSPIAGQSNISGVHTIKGLLDKFRMPIMVRLVHGIIPTRLDRGSFTGVFRLVSTYTDETAFVCPLKKDSKMVPVSTREPLKLVSAQNLDVIEDTLDFKNSVQKCSKMISSYMNSIHVLVHQPDVVPLSKSKEEEILSTHSKVTDLPQTEEDVLFKEVEDIYQYVRDGGKPPDPRPRPVTSSNGDLSNSGKFKKQTDENYWEEPIYERIDKFQKLRRETILINSGTTVSAEINQNYLVDGKEKGTDSGSLGKVSDYEERKEKVAPPIPPKRFDSTDSGSFEEIQSPDESVSSMGISPDSGDNRDVSKSSSAGSLNRSSSVPHDGSPPRKQYNDNSFPRKASSNSVAPDLPEKRKSDHRRHSFTPAIRPTDLPISENGTRVVFRSPTETIETSLSTSRINLRSPNEVPEGPTRVNVRSTVEMLDNQRKLHNRYHSATNLSPNSMNATRIVFNRELQTQMPTRLSNGNNTQVNKGPVTVNTTGNSQNGTSSRSTPKYVAIARVGDPGPTKKNNFNDSNDRLQNDKHSRRFSLDNNPRRQVQSIFL